jgi:hypothetical protein
MQAIIHNTSLLTTKYQRRIVCLGMALIQYNRQLMAEDAAARGWTNLEWSRRAGVSDMSVTRFLRGDSVTPKMVARLAKPLNQKVERYLLRTTGPRQVA